MELPHKEIKRAFALVDRSVESALAKAEESGRKCACAPGCPHCCHQPIPLTPAELMIIMAWIKKRMTPDLRKNILSLLSHNEKDKISVPCPFLIKCNCSIYPVRPIACRRYLVSGRCCHAGEDAFACRHEDLIVPDTRIRDEALALLLPWHGKNWKELGVAPPSIASNGLTWLRNISTVMQAVDWKNFL